MSTPTDPVTAAWQNPEAFTTSLVALYLDHFGTEGLGWSPLTVEMELRGDLGVELDGQNFDRLLTGIDLLTSDAFFVHPFDFARGCVVLAGAAPPAQLMVLPDCAEIAWGITEALLIAAPGPEEAKHAFSPEICRYVGMCLDAEGVTHAPDVLRIGRRPTHPAYAAPGGASPATNEQGDAIARHLRGRMRALLAQLETLPLGHDVAARTELRGRFERAQPLR